ncbi:hypothetical protein CEXT_297431 [Caerostris extrusa]|uniref:Uncharacterized protein n=1 Tax=Caerostris extrusa TaxID=172846 RepID=A0AAV4MEX1_CAEEX|nr:hypothetical protein CEXT_297431 [Caerostris extrusa]
MHSSSSHIRRASSGTTSLLMSSTIIPRTAAYVIIAIFANLSRGMESVKNTLANSISTARHDHRKERISLAIAERSGNPLLSSLLVFDEEIAEGSITLLLQLLGGCDHSVFLTRRLGSPPCTDKARKSSVFYSVFLLWGRGRAISYES